MAITIQDLIASDTISQAVDKINFNFDQLLLNGGGPVGPAGPVGPIGPIGGRGERGSEWYEGTDDPNVTAPTVTPLKADYYLQSNGDVWEYTGLTWTNTGINLTGPQGAVGPSVGWAQFGNSPNPGSSATNNYSSNSTNLSYPAMMLSTDTTISTGNQGIPSVAFGIAGPNDNSVGGITLTNAFQISEFMAGQLDSSKVTMLVHQSTSGARAMSFMGGGGVAGDYFEQDNLDDLSTIFLSKDDRLNIVIPKAPNVGGTTNDRIGFSVDAGYRGQQYRSGNGFSVETGTKGSQSFGADGSDVQFTLNSLTGASETAKFQVRTIGASGTNSLEIGEEHTTAISPDTSFTGGTILQSNRVSVAASNKIDLDSSGQVFLKGGSNTASIGSTSISVTAAGSSNINVTSATGTILIDANGGDLELISNNTVTVESGLNTMITQAGVGITIQAANAASDLNLYSTGVGSETFIKSNTNIFITGNNTTDPYIGIKLNETTENFTQFRGKQAWTASTTDATQTAIADQFILFDTNTTAVTAGDVIQRFGSGDPTGVNAGVAFQVHQGGNGTIAIGKPNYVTPVTSGTYGLAEDTCFVVNNGDTIPQFPATEGTGNFTPQEKFLVSRARTKISNRWISGGENGNNQNYINPWNAFSPNPNLTVTTPYYRLVVGRTTPMTYAQLVAASSHSYNYSFKLQFDNALERIGNRVTVEVVNAPSTFALCQNSGGCYLKSRYGDVTLTYDSWSTSGAIQNSTAGVVSSVAPINAFGGGYVSIIKSKVFEFIFSGEGNTFYNSDMTDFNSQGIVVKAGWRLISVYDVPDDSVTFNSDPLPPNSGGQSN